MQNKRTTLTVDRVIHQVTTLLKRESESKNNNDALWILFKEYRPDLLKKAEQIIEIERGE